jgi:hypothetical protein
VNAKLGKKTVLGETWHSRDDRTRNQIDHCMIDRRYFSGVNDVYRCGKVRT